MKFGILLTAYNFSDTIDQCLTPWMAVEDVENLKFCAVSLPFKEYEGKEIPEDDTAEKLTIKYGIDTITEPKYIPEYEARNLAFDKLKDCDYIWILDSDEVYTEQDIEKIIKFVKFNPEIYYFCINFKNYVFDGKCWVDGFCPPRIFKTKRAKGFYWDNDMMYDLDGQNMSYKQMSMAKIPKNTAHVKHLTWLNNERTKNKIQYQEEHFKGGFGCSYRWNEEKDCLEFNEEYFKKSGEIKPQLNYD